MSSTEVRYQLKPLGQAKLWWSILGVATLLLLLPVGINAVVPDQRNTYEQLSMGKIGYDWEVPVVTETGAPVRCDMTLDDLFMKYWDCNGDTTVVTMLVEGMKDPENTLRRMVRAGLSNPLEGNSSIVASADNRAHVYYEEGVGDGAFMTLPVVALSMRGEGDAENLTAITIINGFSNEYYASHVWSSMAQQRGLPYGQDFPFDLTGEQEPALEAPLSGEIPWEQWLQEHNGAPSGDLRGQAPASDQEVTL